MKKASDYRGEVVTRGDQTLQYQQTGICGFCLSDLEAIQPFGTEPRHIASRVPYGLCAQAVKARSLRHN